MTHLVNNSISASPSDMGPDYTELFRINNYSLFLHILLLRTVIFFHFLLKFQSRIKVLSSKCLRQKKKKKENWKFSSNFWVVWQSRKILISARIEPIVLITVLQCNYKMIKKLTTEHSHAPLFLINFNLEWSTMTDASEQVLVKLAGLIHLYSLIGNILRNSTYRKGSKTLDGCLGFLFSTELDKGTTWKILHQSREIKKLITFFTASLFLPLFLCELILKGLPVNKFSDFKKCRKVCFRRWKLHPDSM